MWFKSLRKSLPQIPIQASKHMKGTNKQTWFALVTIDNSGFFIPVGILYPKKDVRNFSKDGLDRLLLARVDPGWKGQVNQVFSKVGRNIGYYALGRVFVGLRGLQT
jgi:hypothetical protein